MKQQILVLGAALLIGAALTQSAHAQGAANLPPLVGATSKAQGGVFTLPNGVEKLSAVDAQNTIVAQMRPDASEPRQYRLIQIKHVYAGGIAMLFNGSGVIPTGPFVSPGFAQGGQNGGNQGGGNQNVNVGIGGGNQGGNGFFFPQNVQQPGGVQFTPNNGAAQPLRPNNQPGLGLGTPFGNFFVPARNN